MTLVIMAAGMGSRYGGLKQLDPITKNGEFIIDYSIYDAIEAGFDKVVFIIKRENLEIFRDTIGKRIEKNIQVEYVSQSQNIDKFTKDIIVTRTKPWGTAHAILSCDKVVDEPFAVINADDFYGRESFKLLAKFLKEPKPSDNKLHFAMIGFAISNTITENGHVSRGICEMDKQGYLTDIVERVKIQKNGDYIQYEDGDDNWVTLDNNSIASMNCWAFDTGIFDELNKGFTEFLKNNKDNLEKVEYFIPFAIKDLIDKGICDVKVIPTISRWYGVTYKQDKPKLIEFINKMIDDKVYNERLWKSE